MRTRGEHLFLIVFDRRTGRPTVEDLGTDIDSAMEAYRVREHKMADLDVEVALLGSSSEETLRRTHSSYFGAVRGLGSIAAGA